MRKLAPALACLALMAGCGVASRAATGPGHPLTVQNCGADVTFDRVPERVVLLKSAAVPYLHDLGVMGRVTARAGAYPKAYYDDATLAELDRIPLLTDRTDT
ncbi:MAG: ABC transporter substrate-binding protein, partial [Actinoplanes sp.]